MTNPSEVVTTGASPSARIQRVPSPVASPGSCAICGKFSHDEGFLWPQLDYEFYGTVYFCADCVGEFARVFGYISPTDLVGLRGHIAAQDAELNTLRQAVLGLESTVDGLIGDAHRRSTERAERITAQRESNDSDNVASDPVDEPNAQSASSDVGESTVVPAEPEQRPDKQGSVGRRDDLLDTSSADELLGL